MKLTKFDEAELLVLIPLSRLGGGFHFLIGNANVGCIPCAIVTGAWNAPYVIIVNGISAAKRAGRP